MIYKSWRWTTGFAIRLVNKVQPSFSAASVAKVQSLVSGVVVVSESEHMCVALHVWAFTSARNSLRWWRSQRYSLQHAQSRESVMMRAESDLDEARKVDLGELQLSISSHSKHWLVATNDKRKFANHSVNANSGSFLAHRTYEVELQAFSNSQRMIESSQAEVVIRYRGDVPRSVWYKIGGRTNFTLNLKSRSANEHAPGQAGDWRWFAWASIFSMIR